MQSSTTEVANLAPTMSSPTKPKENFMEAGVSGDTGTTKRRRARGRIDKDRQEAVMVPDTVREKKDYLVSLYKASESAALEFNDAVKKVAEDAGMNSSPVGKWIKACAGDSYEKVQKQVTQLALLFADPD